MTPALLTAELARAHEADLRRAAAEARRACGPDGCDGFFSSFVARVRSDLQRVQLGPSAGTAPCPC
jgi:hypothetical protein